MLSLFVCLSLSVGRGGGGGGWMGRKGEGGCQGVISDVKSATSPLYFSKLFFRHTVLMP